MMHNSSSHTDALRSIRGQPVRACSRKVWPHLILNLARSVQSPPTGRHALLIGINYSNTPWYKNHDLAQPQNDVALMKEYLIEHGKWLEDDIVVLTDAAGTPEDRLPTQANIMREITYIRDNKFQNVFFLYTGHSDQRRQPPNRPLRPRPTGAPGRIEEEENDQFIVPTDAVVGPGLENIDHERIVIDDVLHDCLITTLPAGATFLAILDTCHSATLLDLKHHRCNRTHGVKTWIRRAIRKVLVEPVWYAFSMKNGGVAKADSFNVSQICNGFCPRRKKAIYPLAVSISACKDRQRVFEHNLSLTHTVVNLLKVKPAMTLRDIIDAVLLNYELQQKQMKALEKHYRKVGDEENRRLTEAKRKEARRTMPQLGSSGALDLRRLHRWSGLAMRST